MPALIVQHPSAPVTLKEIPIVSPIRWTPLHLDTPASRLDAIHAANQERVDAIVQMGPYTPLSILAMHAQGLLREAELRAQVGGRK